METNPSLKVNTGSRQILSIALPISAAILIPQINLLTNNSFLGHLNTHSLGNALIPGVYYLIFAVAGHGLNNAMQSVFSRYAGAGESGSFHIILSQGIRISLIISGLGILFTWFIAPMILKHFIVQEAYDSEIQFLRIRVLGLPFLYLFQMGNAFLVASLNSRLLIIGFILEAGLNILLDYLLIFGHWGLPAMGFNGAALASVIAECTGMIVVLAVLTKTGLGKRYSLFRHFHFNKPVYKEVMNVSAPLVMQYVISVTTWLVFFFFIEEKGDTAKAISNVMRNVFGITGIFVWAFAATSNTMVSNIIGQGRRDEVIPLITRIMLWSLGFCLVCCVLMNLFPYTIFRVFGQPMEFVEQTVPVARMVSLGLLSMSIANIWLNGVTGTGRTRVNLLIEITAIIVYLLYTWYVMKVDYTSLTKAWSNELVYWATIFGMSFYYLKSGKWLKGRDEIKIIHHQ